MSTKPVKDQVPTSRPHLTEASPYGNRWGSGPASTPHNGPGSIASDPASSPRRTVDPPPTARAAAAPKAQYDDAALREKREQGWDSDGGALGTRE